MLVLDESSCRGGSCREPAWNNVMCDLARNCISQCPGSMEGEHARKACLFRTTATCIYSTPYLLGLFVLCILIASCLLCIWSEDEDTKIFITSLVVCSFRSIFGLQDVFVPSFVHVSSGNILPIIFNSCPHCLYSLPLSASISPSLVLLYQSAQILARISVNSL
jgi:hypothetical protein